MIVKIITDNTDIKNIFKELEKSNLLGIDTEFIRDKTYYPILSLIQLAVNNKVFIFDCVTFLVYVSQPCLCERLSKVGSSPVTLTILAFVGTVFLISFVRSI